MQKQYTGKIADSHTHIFPEKLAEKATLAIGNFYGIGMHDKGLASVLAEHSAKAGISKCLVCSTATKPEQVVAINDFIAEKCNRYDSFYGFATLHPDFEPMEAEVERVCALGLHGVKLHPDFQRFDIDHPSAMPIYRLCAKYGLPILFHIGDDRYDYSSPFRLRRVVELVPDLLCIAAHFGGFARWDDAHDCLKHERIFFDTSSTLFRLEPSRALSLLEYFGADRYFFGSDFPMWDQKEEIGRVLALGLSESENEMIFYKNFDRFFGITI